MKKKLFVSFIITYLLFALLLSYTFATEMMNNAKNTMMNASNSAGNVLVSGKDAIVGAAQDAGNGIKNMVNEATDNNDSAVSTMNSNDNYSATRTSTTQNNNLLGFSSETWTWLILGAVALIIVALVWYYSAQYEHKDYNN